MSIEHPITVMTDVEREHFAHAVVRLARADFEASLARAAEISFLMSGRIQDALLGLQDALPSTRAWDEAIEAWKADQQATKRTEND